jgi:lysophospholipase L1-like esterase
MKLKRTIPLLLSSMMMMTACQTAAGEAKSTADADATTTTTTTTAAATTAPPPPKPFYESVKLLGRTYADMENKVVWCALSGSGVEFTVTAPNLSVTILGDNAATSGNPDTQARIGIYVDGERMVDDMIDAKEKSFVIFEGDEPREALVSIVKLSESANSTFGIAGFTFDGEDTIAPTADKDLLIEFIGDSITCGYGVDDEVKEHHFSTTTEDVTKTYAYKTVQALNADYSMVCYSGYGIISGYTGNGEKNENQTLPQHYDKVGFSYDTFGGVQVSSLTWDFSTRQPDVIVINLGTNDDSYCKSDNEKKQDFTDNYLLFLKQVREKNPDAKILCAFGVQGDNMFKPTESAVAAYTAETGDSNIDLLHMKPQDGSTGYAADWHPTEATHERTAADVTAKIKEMLGM